MKRRHEKHLPYFRVLEAIQRAKGCPLCALEEAAITRYFEGIFYEKVNDPAIRADLRKSGGFCARHAHRLTDFGDGLGTAILYQDQISSIIAEVEAPASGAAKRRRSESAPCPACRFAEHGRARNIRTLLDALEESDPDMLEALAASPGLCYPHLRRVLELAGEEQRARLLEIHAPKLAELLHHLEEYQRKQDYRFAGEQDSEERDSWLRAVEVAVGKRGVF